MNPAIARSMGIAALAVAAIVAVVIPVIAVIEERSGEEEAAPMTAVMTAVAAMMTAIVPAAMVATATVVTTMAAIMMPALAHELYRALAGFAHRHQALARRGAHSRRRSHTPTPESARRTDRQHGQLIFHLVHDEFSHIAEFGHRRTQDYLLGTHESSIGSIKNDIEIGASLYRSVTKPRFTEVNYSSRFYGIFAGSDGRLERVGKGIFDVYEEYVFPPRKCKFPGATLARGTHILYQIIVRHVKMP